MHTTTRPDPKPAAVRGWMNAIALSFGLVCLAHGERVAAQPICEQGQGSRCNTSNECVLNAAATVCIGGASTSSCQIPCDDAGGDPNPVACSLGETCVPGWEPGLSGGARHYCQASRFEMDLNLLDSCIFHFVEGVAPDLSGADECSVLNKLNGMLDQDGDGTFNIYDVDGCVRAFLSEAPCDPVTGSCPDNQVYCTADADCGSGLHCDQALHRCSRECGLIVNRGDSNLVDTLDRQCVGDLKRCDYDHGQCNPVSIDGMTCSVDRDCPSGAYCFLGECQPRCYRSLQCPGSDWYCSTTNTCLPRPKDPNAQEVFDPEKYSVLSAKTSFDLSTLNSEYDLPLVIINRVTKKQIFDDPNVVFGYRLEVKYEVKQEPKCFQDLTALSPAQRNAVVSECYVELDPDKFWITLDNPFGTVFATGDPTLGVRLHPRNVDNLTPGLYRATITAIFNNGNQSSTVVSFRKPSPNGEYLGRVSSYVNGPNNLLGSSNVRMQLSIDNDSPGDVQVEWDQFLAANRIVQDREYRDVTRGYEVHGYIDGSSSTMFNLPTAESDDENRIPIKGIYSPELGRMRLIAVIDTAADQCWSENGPCDDVVPNELQVRNLFGRRTRRLVEFIGPYDDLTHRFEGVYRETFYGVAPSAVTLDGGFKLDQMKQDDTPIRLGPLLSVAQSAPVGFPSTASVRSQVDAEIAQHCAAPPSVTARPTCQPSDAASCHFRSAADFGRYLTSYASSGLPIFPNLVVFETLVTNAIGTLPSSSGYLTIRDFFKGKITLCQSPTDTNCIDEDTLQCGLALYRKAILNNWVPATGIGTAQVDTNLFCSVYPGAPAQGAALSQDCPYLPDTEPQLVSLQDHNRFYKELFQARSYQAGEGLSAAFYTLYKAQNGDTLDASSAYQHKAINLRRAFDLYQQSAAESVTAPATSVMFGWPIRDFATAGDVWLQQLHTLHKDRMQTLLQLVDFRRRVLKSPAQNDFLFAHHVMQQEYVMQAYLLTLQNQWQGAQMRYAGEGPALMDLGADLVAKANDNRNPLGLHPNRIYFENANTQVSNWQNFRDRIQARLPLVEQQIDQAISNMKGALTDEDNFMQSLLLDSQDIEAQLDDLCGSDDPLPDACDLGKVNQGDFEQECVGPSCLLQFECNGPECGEVVKAFSQGTSSDVACRADTPNITVETPTGTRPCVRGRMGSLLQERVSLELQRRDTVRRVQSLLRQIAREQEYIRQTQSSNDALVDYLEDQNVELTVMEGAIVAANTVFEAASAASQGVDCLIIVGLAAGTDCPGKIIKATMLSAATVAKNAVVGATQTAMGAMLRSKEIRITQDSQNRELRQLRMTLDNMVTDVENLVAEYQTVTQQIFNINLQVDDTQFLAERAVARNQDKVAFLIDHLVGRESGDVLVRNKLIERSDREFQRLLLDTYKMTRAFIHRYNLNKQAEQWTNRVYELVTVQDVKDFLQFLTDEEQAYCGGEGIDCDFINNRETFRFSLREELFPALRDIVDPKTGSVLTAGQQFHNIITSSDFVQRRARAYGIASQIEIPFAIWLNDRGTEGGAPKRYMVPPGDCNHIISSVAGGGTIAANVVGTRIPRNPGVFFEVWRGNTDYVRSCTDRSSPVESAINSYIVGWSPNNAFGQLDNPPSFLSLSGELPACINNQQLDDPSTVNSQEGCFKFFARDRSLGAPDWKLVIPRIDEDQSWLLGDGLPAHQKPIIEDIVLYVRYNDRPIAPDN